MLQKKYRLRKDSDLKRVHKRSRMYFSSSANLKILANHKEYPRFAFVVSAKVSPKSTARNRIKRQLSEVLRKNIIKIKPGFDFLFVVKKPITKNNYQEKENTIVKLLMKSKAWKK